MRYEHKYILNCNVVNAKSDDKKNLKTLKC